MPRSVARVFSGSGKFTRPIARSYHASRIVLESARTSAGRNAELERQRSGGTSTISRHLDAREWEQYKDDAVLPVFISSREENQLLKAQIIDALKSDFTDVRTYRISLFYYWILQQVLGKKSWSAEMTNQYELYKQAVQATDEDIHLAARRMTRVNDRRAQEINMMVMQCCAASGHEPALFDLADMYEKAKASSVTVLGQSHETLGDFVRTVSEKLARSGKVRSASLHAELEQSLQLWELALDLARREDFKPDPGTPDKYRRYEQPWLDYAIAQVKAGNDEAALDGLKLGMEKHDADACVSYAAGIRKVRSKNLDLTTLSDDDYLAWLNAVTRAAAAGSVNAANVLGTHYANDRARDFEEATLKQIGSELKPIVEFAQFAQTPLQRCKLAIHWFETAALYGNVWAWIKLARLHARRHIYHRENANPNLVVPSGDQITQYSREDHSYRYRHSKGTTIGDKFINPDYNPKKVQEYLSRVYRSKSALDAARRRGKEGWTQAEEVAYALSGLNSAAWEETTRMADILGVDLVDEENGTVRYHEGPRGNGMAEESME